MTRSLRLALAAAACTMPAAAVASETVTYSYDALARLVAVSTAGGPNDGVTVGTGYDPGGNRSSYSVAGAGTAGLAAPASSDSTSSPAEAIDSMAGELVQDTPPADAETQEEEPTGAMPAVEAPEGEAPEGDTPEGRR